MVVRPAPRASAAIPSGKWGQVVGRKGGKIKELFNQDPVSDLWR